MLPENLPVDDDAFFSLFSLLSRVEGAPFVSPKFRSLLRKLPKLFLAQHLCSLRRHAPEHRCARMESAEFPRSIREQECGIVVSRTEGICVAECTLDVREVLLLK